LTQLKIDGRNRNLAVPSWKQHGKIDRTKTRGVTGIEHQTLARQSRLKKHSSAPDSNY
jgi:hypothetical protein